MTTNEIISKIESHKNIIESLQKELLLVDERERMLSKSKSLFIKYIHKFTRLSPVIKLKSDAYFIVGTFTARNIPHVYYIKFTEDRILSFRIFDINQFVVRNMSNSVNVFRNDIGYEITNVRNNTKRESNLDILLGNLGTIKRKNIVDFYNKLHTILSECNLSQNDILSTNAVNNKILYSYIKFFIKKEFNFSI